MNPSVPNRPAAVSPLGARRYSFARLVGSRAFSLIEILVVVALLSVIMVSLILMFNQTQKAFKAGLTQVDVLESGRTAADLIARDLEQIAPFGNSTNVNFFLFSPYVGTNSIQKVSPGDDTNPENRNNYLQEIYFLTRYNLNWMGIGYKLDPNAYMNGIGSLYRYSSASLTASNMSSVAYPYYSNTFDSESVATASHYYLSNTSKLIDGVVLFRVRMFNTNGSLLTYGDSFTTGFTTASGSRLLVEQSLSANTNEITFAYTAGAMLPAYVEVELGILEDRAYARYRTLTNGSGNDGPPSAAYNYLSNHAAQVHIFRQHIPIRNANSVAH